MASQPETTITSQQPSSKKPRAKPDGSSSNVKVNLDESLNVVLPRSWNQSGECTIIIQIDPSDSTSLDLEGTQGAVGRMETDEEGGMLFTSRRSTVTCCHIAMKVFLRQPIVFLRSYTGSKGETIQRKNFPRTDCHASICSF